MTSIKDFKLQPLSPVPSDIEVRTPLNTWETKIGRCSGRTVGWTDRPCPFVHVDHPTH